MNKENREIALNWALQHMPRESCGVVIIEQGKEVFVPCRNSAEMDDAFAIDPEDYYRAHQRGEIVRIVHSHCYIPARPSEADRVSCEQTRLPWSIVSVPNGEWHDFEPSGFKAPLVGRTWAHGVLDCFSIIRDYYREELGIEVPDFPRDHEWWLKGQNLYFENFEKAGFVEVPKASIQRHDVALMQIMSPVANHGAIYLGDNKILHHLSRRLSTRDVWSGYYQRNTIKVLRHKSLCGPSDLSVN